MLFALLEEPNGDLWIGTHDGLARMRGGRFETITHGVVFQIIDDKRGHFWLTSSHGLTRVDRESIGTPMLRTMTFGKSDGLGSDQCNGATQPAGIRMSDGRLAIPTASGLTIVDPADLHLNRVPPGIVLRDILVDGSFPVGGQAPSPVRPTERQARAPVPHSSPGRASATSSATTASVC